VYAYRFDWNDEPVAPVNFKALYGSAHGLELPFVFGDFSNSFFHAELPEELSGVLVTSPLDGLFTADNANSRERTSAAMMAFWGEFARTGRPGHGNRSDYPEWPAWSQAKSKLVFANGTLAFDATLVEESDLKERVWSTPGLTLAERCAIYLDNTMYPRYPTAELKRRGCRY
jgi:para-nitrobenzyl esterase